MTHGGARPGAGRPKGSLNKRSLEEIEAVKAKYPDWSPLMHLATVANDEEQDVQVRLDAAKAAAPYFHAKPKPVEIYPDLNAEARAKAANARLSSELECVKEDEGLAARLIRAKERIVKCGIEEEERS
nr:hypothetical protein [uncultured Cohaesibacter sp.]